MLWNIEEKQHSIFLKLHYFTLIRKKSRQKQSSGHRLNCIFMNTVGTDNQMKRNICRNVSVPYLIRERNKNLSSICCTRTHNPTFLSLIWRICLHSGPTYPKYICWPMTHWHKSISVFKIGWIIIVWLMKDNLLNMESSCDCLSLLV